MSKFKAAELITTFFYIGKTPYCPGTFGSIAAYLLTVSIIYLSEKLMFFLSSANDVSIAGFYIVGIPVVLSILFILLLIIGVRYSNIYINYTKVQDPKEVVIDEVVGQLLTIILCIPCAIILMMMYSNSLGYAACFWCIITFITFRLFDILKPWPINLIDKNVKGGLGVMLDDIVAAIFASVTTYVVIFLVI